MCYQLIVIILIIIVIQTVNWLWWFGRLKKINICVREFFSSTFTSLRSKVSFSSLVGSIRFTLLVDI